MEKKKKGSLLHFPDEICKSTKRSLSTNPTAFCGTCIVASPVFTLKITFEPSGFLFCFWQWDRS